MINVKKVDDSLFGEKNETPPTRLSEIKDEIYNFWWDNFGWRLREFQTSCQNLIKWFPVIWRDRDWDDSYIFDILKHKLYHTCKYHINNPMFVDQDREIELMTTCIKLIDYIKEEHYSTVAFDFLEAKYGQTEIAIKDSTASKNELIFKNANIQNGTYTQEEYNKEFNKLMSEAREKHDHARRLLFKILEERIERWWV
jgi:hypothetical protein